MSENETTDKPAEAKPRETALLLYTGIIENGKGKKAYGYYPIPRDKNPNSLMYQGTVAEDLTEISVFSDKGRVLKSSIWDKQISGGGRPGALVTVEIKEGENPDKPGRIFTQTGKFDRYWPDEKLVAFLQSASYAAEGAITLKTRKAKEAEESAFNNRLEPFRTAWKASKSTAARAALIARIIAYITG